MSRLSRHKGSYLRGIYKDNESDTTGNFGVQRSRDPVKSLTPERPCPYHRLDSTRSYQIGSDR